METVKEDVSKLGDLKGLDVAQTAATVGAQIGTVLKLMVPVMDNFAGVRLYPNFRNVLTETFATDAPSIERGLDRPRFRVQSKTFRCMSCIVECIYNI